MNGQLMEREMAEQPGVLARLLERFDDDVARVVAAVPRPLAGVVFLARGSSDHAAVFGRYLCEAAAGRPAGLAAPSLHTLYRAEIDYSGYLAVVLSQSGATPEIIEVCGRMRAGGARTVAITNEPASPLAASAEVVLCLGAGRERAVPATKTVTAELLTVTAVAAALGPLPFARSDLDALPGVVRQTVEDAAPALRLAASWADARRMLVAARGPLYAMALETALKLKEGAGVLAEGFSAADLRHGPVAAVDHGVPVLLFDGGGPASADVTELTELLRQRGAPVAASAPRAGSALPLPAGLGDQLSAFPALVRGQQLALASAKVRGTDPDTPRGLTKVTPTH